MRILEFRALVLAVALLPVSAQVAHISSISGKVSVLRGDTGGQAQGIVNTPLWPDDRVTTGPNARADIQFDSANTVRVRGAAEIRLAPFASGRQQVELVKGSVTYNAHGIATPIVAVDTPSVSVSPWKEGTYQFAVKPAGMSEITVWEGDAEVLAPGGAQWISTGQKMMARGPRSDPEFKIVSAISFWRRTAAILRAGMQAVEIASSGSSGDEGTQQSVAPASDNGTSKPSPPAPAPAIHPAPPPPGQAPSRASKD